LPRVAARISSAHRHRVQQLDQVHAQVGVLPEHALDLRRVRVAEHQAEQAHQRGFGAPQALAGDDGGPGEVVALEQLVSQGQAALDLLARVHLLGEQSHR
jgi:hypothetical protein